MITPGMTAILDSGTAAIEVARALRPDLAATIITHSPTTAAALAEHPTVDVFILGGLGGIHPKEGLTTGDPDEAAMKRMLVSRAADTYVVGSTEKLGTVAPYTVVDLSEVAGLVTDAPADHPTVQQLREQGVHVIQA